MSTSDFTAGGAASGAPSMTVVTNHELLGDTHAAFRRIRLVTPVAMHESGVFIITRAKDVEALAKDDRLRATTTEFPQMMDFPDGVLFNLFRYGMLTSNDQDHRRRRAPFSRTFAAKLIADLRPTMRSVAHSVIDGWTRGSQINFVDDYASLIPARIISGMLGLSTKDIPYFTELVYSVSRLFFMSNTKQEILEIEAAAARLCEYVETVLADRRRHPQDDFLSTFLSTADEGNELSSIEITMQIFSMIVGGTDTTRVAFAVLIGLLLDHPDQWDQICEDPSLAPKAVQESLRYEPSVAAFARLTSEDVDLEGHIIPAGRLVLLSTMSAMRDAAAYQEPDVFNIHRTDLPRLHPIFGAGGHRCIGEALARAELEEGLLALTERHPHMRLVGERANLVGFDGIRRCGRLVVEV
ncbi:MAG: cytochrome P450 [Methylocella sp.]